MPKLELPLRCPGRPQVVYFSSPRFDGFKEVEDAAWSALSVLDPTIPREEIVEDLSDSPSIAVRPALGSDLLWSPDGRYLLVIRLHEPFADGEAGREWDFDFLDILNADWVSFHAGERFACFDNLYKWHPDRPHTLLLREGRNTILEAGPQFEELYEGSA
jgi:hypothetical protein